MANFIGPASPPSHRPNFCLTSSGLFSAALQANQRKSEPARLEPSATLRGQRVLVGVFDMARFVDKPAPFHVSPYAACCYDISFKLFISRCRGAFYFRRRRAWATPATRLSGNAETFAVMPHARRE